jgi:hypothetical protein
MSSKPWERKSPSYKRIEDTRNLRECILICCEGKATEPNYFRKFPINSNVIELDIVGEGFNTLSLVKEAIRLKDAAISINKPYNQIWCIFDKDSFSIDIFNSAIYKAQRNGIKIAYSNECFELWYLLHYNFINTACSRKSYKGMLTRCLGHKYKKNDPTMYEKLLPFQLKAIKHSMALLKKYSSCNPAKDNPSTTVHELVQELNKYINDEPIAKHKV